MLSQIQQMTGKRFITIWRNNLLILFCVALIFSSFGSLGQIVYAAEDDYEWEELSDGTVKITNYKGSDTDISIPAQLDGKAVTVIGYDSSGAFSGKGLKSVAIPEGVKVIEQWAFGNNELTTITLPDSLETLQSLAFANNKLTEITIPPNIKVIANSTFSNNELTTIHLHDDVEEIGNSAFRDNQLTSISIPAKVDTIGWRAFVNNPLETIEVHADNPSYKHIDNKGLYTKDGKEILLGISSMDIDSNTEIIGMNAFEGAGLSGDITIPAHIKTIKTGAFQHNEITSITIPNKDLVFDESVQSMFAYQGGLSNSEVIIKADSTSTARAYAEKHGHTFIAISGVEGDYEWEENKDDDGDGLGTVKITKYKGLDTDIIIPAQFDGKDVTVIGFSAFLKLDLKSVQIPERVKVIEQWAFGNNELTSITLPNSLETLQLLSFPNNKLSEVTIPPNIKVIANSTFHNNELTTIHLHDDIEEIGDSAFRDNHLTSISIPAKVQTIGNQAFANNPLETIKVHADNPSYRDIDNIGIYTKDGKELVQGISSMDIDSDTEIIGQYAFSEMGLSGEIVIPEHIQEIKSGAFERNDISSVKVLNKDVKFSVGVDAFFNNQDESEDLTIKADKDSTAKAYAEKFKYSFIAISGTEDGYVWTLNEDPNGNSLETVTISDYVGADTDIEIPTQLDGKAVTIIGEEAFQNKGLTSAIIHNNVHTIADRAFDGNDIATVTVHNRNITFGDDVFANNQQDTRDLTIRSHRGSTARDYAIANHHRFVAFTTPSTPTPVDSDDNGTEETEEPDDAEPGQLEEVEELPDITFDDLEQHWAKAEIELLASKGIINGVAERRFAPERTINRAEFTALLVRSLNLEETNSDEWSFNDVKPGAWYEAEVNRALSAGLITGYSDDTFRPERHISREELSVLMHRAALHLVKETYELDVQQVLEGYDDANDVSSWALQSMAYSVEHGIVLGTTASQLAPQKEATRAQAAVMLYRLLDKLDLLDD